MQMSRQPVLQPRFEVVAAQFQVRSVRASTNLPVDENNHYADYYGSLAILV
jgi:hypothetical protein